MRVMRRGTQLLQQMTMMRVSWTLKNNKDAFSEFWGNEVAIYGREARTIYLEISR